MFHFIPTRGIKDEERVQKVLKGVLKLRDGYNAILFCYISQVIGQ